MSRASRASSPKRSAWASARRRRSTPTCAERAHDGDAQAEDIVAPSAINSYYYPKQARAAERRLDVAQRIASSDEVQLGLAAADAGAEAQRCFSCGTCIHCDNCVVYCPDLAVRRTNGGYAVLTDYCKGCGLCVEECPTGSMKMIEEQR